MLGYVWAYLFIYLFLPENHVVKNQKFAVDNNVQTSQVNNSIVFLCMGTWNSLVHLKIFTRYASQLSRGQFIQSPECFLFFPFWIPSGCTAAAAAAAAKSLQSCPTLCDHIDGSPPGPPVPGIRQARTVEWAAISFSSAWKWKVKVKSLSRVRLLPTPWITAYQAPLSMEFSRQEYWSGLPLPSPRVHCPWVTTVANGLILVEMEQQARFLSTHF